MPIVWKNDQGAWYLADLKLRKPRYWITDEEGQRWFHARDLKRGHQMTQAEVDVLGASIRLSLVFDLPALSLPFDLRPAGTRFGKPVKEDPPHRQAAIPKVSSLRPVDPGTERQNRYDRLRRNLKPLYAWQEAAHAAWRDAGRIGVVEAATGAGKTRLAFEAIADGCLDNYKVLVLVSTMPLLEQWVSGLLAGFGESLRLGRFDGNIHDSFLDKDVIVASEGSAFENPIQGLPDNGKTFLIADGIGCCGDTDSARSLFGSFSWRLSLTSIFSRNDDRVLKALLPCFKGLCFSYSIKDAVADNIVPRYELTWLRATSTRELAEFDRRYEALAALEDWFSKSDRSLVFGSTLACAEESERVISELGLGVRVLHAGLSSDDQSYTLSEFKAGTVKILCVPLGPDEGIDVVGADFVVMMAAKPSERQFIQRIGRVIRTKTAGRRARLVIMYAEGTLEDPAGAEADSVYGDLAEGAEVVRYLDFIGKSLVKRQTAITRSRAASSKDQTLKAPKAVLLKTSRPLSPPSPVPPHRP